MTLADFLIMAAVIVAACLVYNFVKAYTKKKQFVDRKRAYQISESYLFYLCDIEVGLFLLLISWEVNEEQS